MTDARKTPEDEVLQHFREQATGEPPAHLDAFILATAHREVPVPKPSLWQRWVQACQKPRWQVAFASLVGVAPVLTRDQVALLESDNVVAESAEGLDALGIQPTGIEAIAPAYLWRYRRGGQFSERPTDTAATVQA